MKVIRNTICLVLLTSIFGCFGQDLNIESILDSTRAKLSVVESYTADAVFRVDIDFVNMPDKKARIHFQTPDKLDIETDGFAMIPKIGMKPMIKHLDLDRYHAVYVGEEMVNNNSCFVIKMFPKNRNNKIVTSTLWIGANNFLILRWESFTKKGGDIVIDLIYDDVILPSQIIFGFELGKMNIPLKYFGNDVSLDESEFETNEVHKGKVYIDFENYNIVYSSATVKSD